MISSASWALLWRAPVSISAADRPEIVGDTATFRLDPNDPAFAKESGWQDTFDDLRERPRKRGERIGEWRKRVPIRAIAFRTAPAARRPGHARNCASPSRAPFGPTAAVALPVSGLPGRTVAHFRDRRARCAAARRTDGTACRLRRRRGAAARGDHSRHRDLDRGRPRKTNRFGRSARAARSARSISSRTRCATRGQRLKLAVARIQALVEQRHRRSCAGVRADRKGTSRQGQSRACQAR